jgi:tRNA-specific 2-thiouridylase
MLKNNHSQKTKVVVGLSGGIDSAATLILLKKQDYQPVGLTLKYAAWQNKENIYSNQQSIQVAKKVCRKLKVPHYTLDCQQEFKKKVIGHFLSLLKNKKTPNPCVICNQKLKFKKLFDFAKEKGIKYVATGHYARIKKSQKGEYQLLQGKDRKKDQSYFLCLLDQRKLKNIIFPLGDYTKKQIYQIAKKEGFDFLIRRKQSQDLCFVTQKSMPFFLKKEIGLQIGSIVDAKGRILGEHQGLHFYTIGQRKGIKLSGGPWWVIGFDKKKNQLMVTNKENDSALSQGTVILSNYHFISGKTPKKTIRVKAKTRFNQSLASAKLYPPQKNNLKLVFEQSQKAVTPGQWAVFYQGEVCLGGGMINSAF